MSFTPSERDACQRLVTMALAEDLAQVGDLTSQTVIPEDLQGTAAINTRVDGVLCGLPAAELVLASVDPRLALKPIQKDGDRIVAGMQVGMLSGPMRSLLTAERTVLNFMQYLSGIATLTRKYVDCVAGLKCQILDTRKTLPGYRQLAKYAVRCGGGHNHRMGLHDGILIKDNHLAALGPGTASVAEAVKHARSGASVPIEVEVDTLEQLDVALTARPDIILLDNMKPDLLREAVRRRDAQARQIKLEASGGVTLTTLRAIAESGVDCVSIGALTHSAPALDLGLDYLLS